MKAENVYKEGCQYIHELFYLFSDDVKISCTELRAKRFISDGFCTSIKPIKEVVCAGHCFPIKEQNLPWWAEFKKYWAKPKFKEWRCVEDVTKLKKVQLMCENGETRTYKIKIVKSCKCKRFDREPNRTGTIESKRRRSKRRNRDRRRVKKDRERRKRDRRDRKHKRNNDRKRERRRKNTSTIDSYFGNVGEQHFTVNSTTNE